MPMSKIDQARTVVMLTDAVRDALLSNLNDMPDDWDGFEVRQAVLETCRGMISVIPNIARRRAFEKAFFGGNFTRQKPAPDARLIHGDDHGGQPFIVMLDEDGNTLSLHNVDEEG